MASKPRISRFFAENQIVYSSVFDKYYFARKVEMLDGGMRRVVGKKYDVTDAIAAIKASVNAGKKRKRAGGSK